MPSNFVYPAELACPHDGWYNGNPKLMILNGTYLDYRHRLVEWVAKRKMTQADLDNYDKQWAAIPLEKKKERRGKVLESIKKIPVRQKDGKVTYVSKPSDNGSASMDERKPEFRRQLTVRQPHGSLDSRPDPFANELPSSLSAEDGPMLGRSVPQSLPGAERVPAAGLAMAMV